MDIPTLSTVFQSNFITNFDLYFEPCDENSYNNSALNIPRVASLLKSLSLDTVLG